jgi:hypothetical protein
MKKRSKLDTSPRKQAESQALTETVARYKARREAVGRDLFLDYDLALVAQIAAQISKSEYSTAEDAVEHALKILDAARKALSIRAEKLKTIKDAPVPVQGLQYNFQDGIRAITQEKRGARAEEYFRKFLVSEVGREGAAEELARLKRDGFTSDEVKNYESRYAEFCSPRKQKN